jgi:hypothetical protein
MFNKYLLVYQLVSCIFGLLDGFIFGMSLWCLCLVNYVVWFSLMKLLTLSSSLSLLMITIALVSPALTIVKLSFLSTFLI